MSSKMSHQHVSDVNMSVTSACRRLELFRFSPTKKYSIYSLQNFAYGQVVMGRVKWVLC